MRGFIAKLRRDVRALSPIFAVLILIAIAVIAGIIIYMFTSGYLGTMMGGGTAGQEKVAIEAVEVNATALTDVIVWAKSTGGGAVNVTEAILKDASGNVVDVAEAVNIALPETGVIVDIPLTFAVPMQPGYTYTVTLVSQLGNQFVSPSFKAPVS